MSPRVTIRPTSSFTSDVQAVARALRDEDVDELWQLSRTDPVEAVRKSVEISTETYVAYHGDEPIAVLGAYIPVLGRHGVPWLLGTRGVDNCALDYLRYVKRFTAHLLETCDVIENVALASNTKTLGFLSLCGFAIGEPFKTQAGAMAVRFHMERATDV